MSQPRRRLVSRRLAWGGAVAAAVVAVDQATKSWALAHLDDGPIHLVWTLRLNLSFNTGAAFGLGRGLAPLLVPVAVLVVGLLLGMGRVAAASTGAAVALALVTGGALGNLADRLFRDHGGAVVDFIDLQWWPVFNVADAAITCGAALLLLTGARQGQEQVAEPAGRPEA